MVLAQRLTTLSAHVFALRARDQNQRDWKVAANHDRPTNCNRHRRSQGPNLASPEMNSRIAGFSRRRYGASVSEAFNALPADQRHFTEYDLMDLPGIPSLVKGSSMLHPGLYGLVNNAGVGLAARWPHSLCKRYLARVLTLNLRSAHRTVEIRRAPQCCDKRGRIVVSPPSSHLQVQRRQSMPRQGQLEGSHAVPVREVGRAGITVNCGYMLTTP
jgi:NAD(P)-dependent dehydrogenase (short-subunit alcohol dehydrogenase family)